MTWRGDPFEHSLAARGIKSRNMEVAQSPMYEIVDTDLDSLMKRYQDSDITLKDLGRAVNVIQHLRKIRKKRSFLSVLLYLCELTNHPRTEELRRMLPENLNTVGTEKFIEGKIDPVTLTKVMEVEDDFLGRSLDDIGVTPDAIPFDEDFLKKPMPAAYKEKKFSRLPVLREFEKRKIDFQHIREYNKMVSMMDETDPEYNDAVAKVMLSCMPKVIKSQTLRKMDEKPRITEGKALKTLQERGVDIITAKKYMKVVYRMTNVKRVRETKLEVI